MQASPSDETKFHSAMLQGIRDDLFNYAMPELTSGEAKEHVQFAHLTLDRFCNELALGSSLAQIFCADYSALVAEVERELALQNATETNSSESLPSLRTRLSASISKLSDFGNRGETQTATSAQLLKKILALESRLKQAIGAAQQAASYKAPGNADSASREMTTQTLSDYLRKRFPKLSEQPITNLRVLPGGRSKKTVFVTLKPNDDLPCEVVIRQDMPGGAVDNIDGTTSVIHEYPVLSGLAGKGLPIARALFVEAKDSECGAPFMVVERSQGTTPGSFFGFFNPQDPITQSTVKDMARVLARLHGVDVTQLGLRDDLTLAPEERLRREVDYRWKKWQRDTVEPSPIIECALARLRAECRPGLGGPSLVHGDAMAHNLLVVDGKITAMLDWEFVHVGDPAQDLAYCRNGVEQVMPWDEFMAIYVASGGKPISEKRLAIFGLVGWVRNSSFSATFARRYMNRQSDDFSDAAAGYFSIPILEAQMIALLNRLDSI
jgi:aminoglycoside phosphotransferase (APT) family kinase protein